MAFRATRSQLKMLPFVRMTGVVGATMNIGSNPYIFLRWLDNLDYLVEKIVRYFCRDLFMVGM